MVDSTTKIIEIKCIYCGHPCKFTLVHRAKSYQCGKCMKTIPPNVLQEVNVQDHLERN